MVKSKRETIEELLKEARSQAEYYAERLFAAEALVIGYEVVLEKEIYKKDSE